MSILPFAPAISSALVKVISMADNSESIKKAINIPRNNRHLMFVGYVYGFGAAAPQYKLLRVHQLLYSNINQIPAKDGR